MIRVSKYVFEKYINTSEIINFFPLLFWYLLLNLSIYTTFIQKNKLQKYFKPQHNNYFENAN